ncbi:unnamed protein product [Nippostrongylus brasiliensis]|uniref:Uncharacterized protein n=1 Tax=Nippostrongylus brasiliensis TaxID=27835 RepID=A0A3P7BF63_NIPBR|nr:unnamed protein product [Nippostrongylus brasiliensis]
MIISPIPNRSISIDFLSVFSRRHTTSIQLVAGRLRERSPTGVTPRYSNQRHLRLHADPNHRRAARRKRVDDSVCDERLRAESRESTTRHLRGANLIRQPPSLVGY